MGGPQRHPPPSQCAPTFLEAGAEATGQLEAQGGPLGGLGYLQTPRFVEAQDGDHGPALLLGGAPRHRLHGPGQHCRHRVGVRGSDTPKPRPYPILRLWRRPQPSPHPHLTHFGGSSAIPCPLPPFWGVLSLPHPIPRGWFFFGGGGGGRAAECPHRNHCCRSCSAASRHAGIAADRGSR